MYFQTIGTIIGAVIGIYLGVLAIDRDPPADLIGRTLLTPEVQPGGQLRYINHVNRERNCSANIERFIIDGTNFRYELNRTALSYFGPTGIMDYGQSIIIPETATTGAATLTVTLVYECNWLHNFYPIIVTHPVLDFKIVNKQRN